MIFLYVAFHLHLTWYFSFRPNSRTLISSEHKIISPQCLRFLSQSPHQINFSVLLTERFPSVRTAQIFDLFTHLSACIKSFRCFNHFIDLYFSLFWSMQVRALLYMTAELIWNARLDWKQVHLSCVINKVWTLTISILALIYKRNNRNVKNATVHVSGVGWGAVGWGVGVRGCSRVVWGAVGGVSVVVLLLLI